MVADLEKQKSDLMQSEQAKVAKITELERQKSELVQENKVRKTAELKAQTEHSRKSSADHLARKSSLQDLKLQYSSAAEFMKASEPKSALLARKSSVGQ